MIESSDSPLAFSETVDVTRELELKSAADRETGRDLLTVLSSWPAPEIRTASLAAGKRLPAAGKDR